MIQVSEKEIALSNAQTIALAGCSFMGCNVTKKDGNIEICTHCKSEIIKWLLKAVFSKQLNRVRDTRKTAQRGG